MSDNERSAIPSCIDTTAWVTLRWDFPRLAYGRQHYYQPIS
jgi:hypothetical protein